MSTPSYHAETLALFFRPFDEGLLHDPKVGDVFRHFAETDPDILGAVADVFRQQIRSALDLPPMDRLRRSCAILTGLTGWRRVG